MSMMQLKEWSESNFLDWCAEWRRHWILAVCSLLSGVLYRLLLFKLVSLRDARSSVLSPAAKATNIAYFVIDLLGIPFLLWLLGKIEDPHKRLIVLMFSFFLGMFSTNVAKGLFSWLVWVFS
jgi:hypothetical protein